MLPFEASDCRRKVRSGDHPNGTVELAVIREPLKSDIPGEGKDGDVHVSIVPDAADRAIRCPHPRLLRARE